MQRIWIEPSEDASEGIVGWDSIFECEKASQPGFFGASKVLNVDSGVCTTDDAQYGNDDDIDQRMALCPIDARVGDIGKQIEQRMHRQAS